MSRSGSLGPPPPTSVPAPSASLSRSASLPHHAGMGGPLPSSHHRRSDSARGAAGSRPGSQQGEPDGGSPGTDHGGAGAAGPQRSAALEAQPRSQPMAPAPGSKLEKDDVMR